MYARAYLVRKSYDIDPTLKMPVARCITDAAATLRQVREDE